MDEPTPRITTRIFAHKEATGWMYEVADPDNNLKTYDLSTLAEASQLAATLADEVVFAGPPEAFGREEKKPVPVFIVTEKGSGFDESTHIPNHWRIEHVAHVLARLAISAGNQRRWRREDVLGAFTVALLEKWRDADGDPIPF